MSRVVKLVANMEADTFRQSEQLHTNVSTSPGGVNGWGDSALMVWRNCERRVRLTATICTAPQRQVRVASVSVDHPSFTL